MYVYMFLNIAVFLDCIGLTFRKRARWSIGMVRTLKTNKKLIWVVILRMNLCGRLTYITQITILGTTGDRRFVQLFRFT